MRLRFLFYFLFCLLWIAPWPVVASEPNPLQLSPNTRSVEVTQHMAILLDRDANLTIEQVAAADASSWAPITGLLSMGFTKTVVWLRLVVAPLPLANETSQPMPHWLLEVTQPSLTHVQLYHQQPNGQFAHNAGTRNDNNTAPSYQHRSGLFDLPVDTSQAQTIYLRLQSETSMSSTFVVWEERAFWSHNTRITVLWGLLYGFCMLVVMLHWAFSFWSQNRVHLFYAFYIVSTFSVSFLASGWHLVLTEVGSMEQWLYVLGILSSMTLFAGISFGILYLGALQTHPVFARIQIGTSLIVSTCTLVGVGLGYYLYVIPLYQFAMMILICSNIVLALLELRNGNRHALWFLWGFGIFYAGVIIRLLRNRGWLEPSVLTETSYQIGAFVHIFIISYGIIASYNKLQQEKKAAIEVANKETAQRKEQAVFLGMVSHELRTPLTIISTALDNLHNHPDDTAMTEKRIQKIARATHRMQSLVESFLNAERMNQTRFEPHQLPCKLDNLAKEAIDLISERTGHPITLNLRTQSPVHCMADKQLLQLAINNIVLNAVQHSPPSVQVQVTLSVVNDIVLEIRNQGDPIDADDLPKLFDRYHRGKNARNRPGTGLGLHVAHTIVNKHGGTLQAANLPDGCIFTLCLPLNTPAKLHREAQQIA
jgi:signal transduction histidine kinase